MTGTNGHQASDVLKEIETRLFINGEVGKSSYLLQRFAEI
jgi:hypothetical protein